MPSRLRGGATDRAQLLHADLFTGRKRAFRTCVRLCAVGKVSTGLRYACFASQCTRVLRDLDVQPQILMTLVVAPKLQVLLLRS